MSIENWGHKMLNGISGWLFLYLSILVITFYTFFHPILPNLLFNVLIPFVLWLPKLKGNPLFVSLKMGTLMIPRVIIFCGAMGFLAGASVVDCSVFFLALNIAEAFIIDIRNKNYFHALTGLILILACAKIHGIWKEDTYVFITSKHFIYYLIPFVLWHQLFVYNRFGQSLFCYHLFIHAVSILCLILLGSVNYYLTLRGISLLYGGLIQVYLPKEIENYYQNSERNKEMRLLGKWPVQATVFGICAVLVALFVTSQ